MENLHTCSKILVDDYDIVNTPSNMYETQISAIWTKKMYTSF